MMVFVAAWVFHACSTPAHAQKPPQGNQVFNQSGLKIPRFVSLRSEKVFVRTGPALRYPIKWVFVKKNLPVEVVQEFDTWRKIRDSKGEEGWIHQSLLQGKRFALISAEEEVFLMRKPMIDSRFVAKLEPMVVLSLEECSGSWCFAEAGGFKGWLEKKSLWGVYETEELD